MKDETTLNLIQNSKCSPHNKGLRQQQGVVCLITLAAIFSPFVAVSGPFDNCARQIEDKIEDLYPSTALVVTNKIPTISFKNAINGRLPKVRNTPYFEFQVHDGSFLTVIDLNSPKVRAHPVLNEALDLWEKHTEKEYRRLPKFADLPPGALQGRDYPDRTVVIIKSKKSLNDGNIEVEGGARIVFAHESEEKLPYQNEFPGLPRAESAAEPGRLTASGFSPLLLHFTVRTIERDPSIKEIYVHTSQGHEIVYGRNGAKTKDVVRKDKDNVLLRFSRLQIREIIKKTKDKMMLSAS
jgi:hypothetical protein